MSLSFDFVEACEKGDLVKAKALHRRGAHIHTWGDWAFRWAAWNGHLDVVNYLREVTGTRYKCHECLIKSTCLELCKDFRTGEE